MSKAYLVITPALLPHKILKKPQNWFKAFIWKNKIEDAQKHHLIKNLWRFNPILSSRFRGAADKKMVPTLGLQRRKSMFWIGKPKKFFKIEKQDRCTMASIMNLWKLHENIFSCFRWVEVFNWGPTNGQPWGIQSCQGVS